MLMWTVVQLAATSLRRLRMQRVFHELQQHAARRGRLKSTGQQIAQQQRRSALARMLHCWMNGARAVRHYRLRLMQRPFSAWYFQPCMILCCVHPVVHTSLAYQV